jgi:Spy/CpxP family protein refolding chaperone
MPVRPRSFLPFVGASLLALTLSTPAFAGPPEGRGHGGKIERFCAKAECTDAQRTEIKRILGEFRTDVEDDHAKIRDLHEKLAAEFAKDKPDEKRMKQLEKQIQTVHAAIVDRRHDMAMEIHGVLTPAQRKLAGKLLLQRGKRDGKDRDGKGPKG